MSLHNSGHRRSSHKRSAQPVFPYAVIPEKKSFWVRNRRQFILVLAVIVVAGLAVGVVILRSWSTVSVQWNLAEVGVEFGFANSQHCHSRVHSVVGSWSI